MGRTETWLGMWPGTSDSVTGHGTKRIVISDTNMGIMAAWREAWSWRDREMFIVIEDDVEMSTLWYRALVNMWTAHGDR